MNESTKGTNPIVNALKKSNMTAITAVLVLMIIIASVASPYFLDIFNLQSVIRDLAFVGMIGVAQSMLLLIGELDLSVGKIASLCGILSGMMMVYSGFNPWLSLILALLVNSEVKGVGVFRSIYYLPVTMAISVASVTWALMMNVNNGVFNSVLSIFGIPKQGFFTDAGQALWSIVIMATWKGCGYWMMYLLAGLKGVDVSLYESAKLDGAGFFTTLFKITLPLISRAMLFVVVANTSANFLLFAPTKLITEGGPQNSTNVLMYEVYKSAFKNGHMSRAGAITAVLLGLIIILVVLQFLMMNRKDVDA